MATSLGSIARARSAAEANGAALADARLRLFSQLASALAHEARNPLHALALHLEVLADKVRDERGAIPAPLAANFEAARRQIARLDELVRRQTELHAGEPGELSAEPLLGDVVALAAHAARRASVSVRVERAAASVRASEAATLRQALLASLLALLPRLEPGEELGLGLAAEGHAAKAQGAEAHGAQSQGAEAWLVAPRRLDGALQRLVAAVEAADSSGPTDTERSGTERSGTEPDGMAHAAAILLGACGRPRVELSAGVARLSLTLDRPSAGRG